MRILDALRPSSPVVTSERSADWLSAFTFNGLPYGTLAGSTPNRIDGNFLGYVNGIHRSNSVVSAAVVVRSLLLSQLRFAWRDGAGAASPGRLHSTSDLDVLDRPGSMTRPELLFAMEHDASYAGTSYLVRPAGGPVRRLRPDWVTVVLGSDSEPSWDGDVARPPYDAEVTALIYHPTGARPTAFFPGEFARWMPEPDAVNWWRGSSWVTSLMAEINIDSQVTDHQTKFFENAATPNLVFVMDPTLPASKVQEYADVVNSRHAGSENAYRNMYLGGGTDVKVVGTDLEHMALRDVSGAFETRVAARSRVPAVVLGIREGLAGSALNAGNYGQTRRLLADGWFFPTAENLCASLESIVRPPQGAELAFDPSRVMFLQEDQQDAADIIAKNAATIGALVREGFDPTIATNAVVTGDLAKLKHSGLVSVQLQAPGANNNAADAPSGAST